MGSSHEESAYRRGASQAVHMLYTWLSQQKGTDVKILSRLAVWCDDLEEWRVNPSTRLPSLWETKNNGL